MFGSEISDVVGQLREMNLLLREVVRLLRNVDERLPACTCNDEHSVGETWTCMFHGTKTRVE